MNKTRAKIASLAKRIIEAIAPDTAQRIWTWANNGEPRRPARPGYEHAPTPAAHARAARRGMR